MEKEYVTKWQPGQPDYRAALPAPTVHYLKGHSPECRLIAIFYPVDRDLYLPAEFKRPYITRMLYLDYSIGLDHLGNQRWRDLDKLFEEDRPEPCQNGCPSLKVCRSLMNHLAAALVVPTAAEVEAGLQWEEVPDIQFPPEET